MHKNLFVHTNDTARELILTSCDRCMYVKCMYLALEVKDMFFSKQN